MDERPKRECKLCIYERDGICYTLPEKVVVNIRKTVCRYFIANDDFYEKLRKYNDLKKPYCDPGTKKKTLLQKIAAGRAKVC